MKALAAGGRALTPLLVLVVIATALALALARLALPSVGAAREPVARWLSEVLERPVAIGSLHAELRGWTPVLRVEDLVFLDGAPLTVGRLEIRIAPLKSLRSGRLWPSRVTIVGARFAVVRNNDGRITLSGFEPAADPQAHESERMGTWLFERPRMELRDARILWHDQRAGHPPAWLTGVQLTLRNEGTRHQLQLDAALPADWGTRLRVALDVQGDLGAGRWEGELYVEAEALRVDGPLAPRLASPIRIEQGRAGFELWTRWSDGRLQAARGRVRLAEAVLRTARARLPLTAATTDLEFRQQESGWRFALSGLEVAGPGGPWSSSGLQLESQDRDGARGPLLAGQIDALRVAELLPLVLDLLPAESAEGLPPDLRGAGEIRDVRFLYRPDKPLPERLWLRARLHGLGLSGLPEDTAFQRLSGRLRIDGPVGALDLATRDATLLAPALFAGPLSILSLDGGISWRHDPDGGWLLATESLRASTPDLRFELSGQVLQRPGAAPAVRLLARAGELDLGALPRYLPVRRMSVPLSRWLHRAIVGGRMESADLILQGSLADFPFDHGEGRFQARVVVGDVLLDYTPSWPRAEQLDAELLFNGRSLDVRAAAGNILEATLEALDAHIADLDADEAVLELRGIVSAPGDGLLRFLRESPIAAEVEPLGEARISDRVRARLGLRVPLEGSRTAVDGVLEFAGNRLDLLGVTLEAVHGELGFTREGIQADGVRARLLGMPVSLAVESRQETAGAVREIQARGRLSPAGLAALLGDQAGSAAAWLKHLRGETGWQASVEIRHPHRGPPPAPALTLRSDLAGLAVALPAPLGKTAGERRPLVLETRLDTAPGTRLRFRYGDSLRGAAVRARPGERGAWTRGIVSLGPTEAEVPPEPGWVIQGSLEELDLGAWLAAGTVPAGPAPSPLRRIRIDTRVLALAGRRFEDVSLSAEHDPQSGWQAGVRSNRIIGSVRIPAGGEPIGIDLERLDLPEPSGPGEAPPDPRTLPAVDLVCRDLRVGDMVLGELRLSARPTATGLRLSPIEIRRLDTVIRATGDWTVAQSRHRSEFEVEAVSPSLGELLETFAYEGTAVEGGATRIKLTARWPGPPGDFALARLEGELRLAVQKGRLLGVEAGAAGRIFGLLSLQSLPRRLRLDFTDLFQRGLSFDRIDGSFRFDGGDAYTNDLQLLGPAARIDVAGRTGLVAEDYDQVVTVTPAVSTSTTLPIAGAILGGPAGAAAALLAQTVFRSQIEQAVRYQYTIQGPWKEPRIERVREETD